MLTIVIHSLVALSSERMEVTKLGKRKMRVVSLLEIIEELKTGKSQRVVASDFELYNTLFTMS